MVLLELDAIRGLLISTVVFGDISLDIKDLWMHACDCAAVAGITGKFLNIKDVDKLTAAGLLHDMGNANVLDDILHEIDNTLYALNWDELYRDI